MSMAEREPHHFPANTFAKQVGKKQVCKKGLGLLHPES